MKCSEMGMMLFFCFAGYLCFPLSFTSAVFWGWINWYEVICEIAAAVSLSSLYERCHAWWLNWREFSSTMSWYVNSTNLGILIYLNTYLHTSSITYSSHSAADADPLFTYDAQFVYFLISSSVSICVSVSECLDLLSLIFSFSGNDYLVSHYLHCHGTLHWTKKHLCIHPSIHSHYLDLPTLPVLTSHASSTTTTFIWYCRPISYLTSFFLFTSRLLLSTYDLLLLFRSPVILCQFDQLW